MRFLTPRKMAQLAVLIGFGLILYLFENLLPRPLPWIKLGLAQTAGLLALYLMGWREAICVTVGRVFVGTLLVGEMGGPAFWLSLIAGLTAIWVMVFVRHLAKNAVSIIGVSLCGAMTHNLTQLLLVYWLFVRSEQIFFLLPFLMLPAIVAGLVIGLVSGFLIEQLHRLSWPVR